MSSTTKVLNNTILVSKVVHGDYGKNALIEKAKRYYKAMRYGKAKRYGIKAKNAMVKCDTVI